MKILSINCGSSTLKFRLFNVEAGETQGLSAARRVAGGAVARIGDRAKLEFNSEGGEGLATERRVRDHDEATRLVLDWLHSIADPAAAGGIDAAGHRVVHGGPSFTEPTLLDDWVISELEALSDLAPLHNVPSVAAIRAARATLGSTIPMVATFDTAFFRELPERASQYAIPYELAEKHGVRRYGFHGLAHRYMLERYAQLTSRSVEETRLITLQLGNGCSVTAVERGRPIDTSMGFTPLEGLVMGTRSGDVDPAIVTHLARAESVDAEEVVNWLNTRSGLRGLSGSASDMRDLQAAEAAGDRRAAIAVEMFCYRAKKYVGAYLSALGGADALVFGGGIGENSPAVRARICEGMNWCGLRLDLRRNDKTIGSEGRISADDSRVAVYALPVDEELVIAQDTARCLAMKPGK